MWVRWEMPSRAAELQCHHEVLDFAEGILSWQVIYSVHLGGAGRVCKYRSVVNSGPRFDPQAYII